MTIVHNQIGEIMNRYCRGEKPTEISEFLDLPVKKVYYILRRLRAEGIELPVQKPKFADPELRREVRKFVNNTEVK